MFFQHVCSEHTCTYTVIQCCQGGPSVHVCTSAVLLPNTGLQAHINSSQPRRSWCISWTAMLSRHSTLPFPACSLWHQSRHLGVTYEVGKQAAVNRVGTALHARVQVCTYDQSKNLRQGLQNSFKVRVVVGPCLGWPTCRPQWARLMQ
jgi:hypothetical protein